MATPLHRSFRYFNSTKMILYLSPLDIRVCLLIRSRPRLNSQVSGETNGLSPSFCKSPQDTRKSFQYVVSLLENDIEGILCCAGPILSSSLLLI